MNDPADKTPPARAKDLVGPRWASGLGVALVAAFALLTAARWLQKLAVAIEEIVQVPVPAAVPTPTPEVLAPDPGDNP